MKKIFLIAVVSLLTITANAQRFSNNSGYLPSSASYSVVFATDSISPNSGESFYQFGTLTAAKTITIKSNSAKKWDKVTIEFTCDTLTAGRVVTFNTGTNPKALLWTTSSGNTMTVKASKKALISFIFDGTYWCEDRRSVQY